LTLKTGGLMGWISKLAVLVTLPLAAYAGDVADLATQIEEALAEKDAGRALQHATTIMTTAWDATEGLGFTAVVPVLEVPQGYGIYNPREGTVYKVGEPIILYAEPFGYGYGQTTPGIYTIGFDVDLRVLGMDGTVVAEAPGVLAVGMESRHKNREFMADMTFNLGGLAPGKYQLETTLRDKNSAKWGQFVTEVEVVE
jgi:hypothetical protein